MASPPTTPGARTRHRWSGALRLVALPAGLAATTWLVVHALRHVRASAMPPWTLARASGITTYALLTVLVCVGLLLAHPTVRHRRAGDLATRIRLHELLAVFTLAFLVLHVAALVADPWAHVGWAGALLPMASHYRPVPVALGVLAVWSGLLTGLTAALAGRWLGAFWWPVHRVALLAFVLAWAHGLWSGSDSGALLGMYLASGAAVLALALSRYRAPTAADLRVEQAGRWPATSGRGRP
ncbi:MAG TPA: hypothetical protein VFL69_04015 [Marmoricola sp.]|nr:hypothetical protein [Marmoricola sp.]